MRAVPPVESRACTLSPPAGGGPGEGLSEGLDHVQINAERSPWHEKTTHTHTRFKHKTTHKTPALVLTGERQHGQLQVYVWGHTVWLTVREFRTICKLARTRRYTRTGYVQIDKLLICLLRAAIDKQTGQEGLGNELIQTGNYQEYRLCDEAKDFQCDPTLDELPKGVIDPELKDALCVAKPIDAPSKPR